MRPGFNEPELVDIERVRGYHFDNSRGSRERRGPDGDFERQVHFGKTRIRFPKANRLPFNTSGNRFENLLLVSNLQVILSMSARRHFRGCAKDAEQPKTTIGPAGAPE